MSKATTGVVVRLLVAALIASVVGYGVTRLTTQSPHAAPLHSPISARAILVGSIAVPWSSQVKDLAVANGELIAYGEFDAPLATEPSCISATVQQSPMELLAKHAYDCRIPVPGEVAAASYQPLGGARFYDDDFAAGHGKVNAQLRISLKGTPSSGTTLGPVVMKFAGVSNTWPATAQAASSIWAYDCAAGGLGGNGEAVQASAATGRVETSVVMPSDCWSSIGADAAGAFIASFDNPGPIYFVATHSAHARVLLANAGAVRWYDAVGDSMFIDVGGQQAPGKCSTASCGIWRFKGPKATPSLLTLDRPGDMDALLPVDGGSLGLLAVVSTPTWPHLSVLSAHIVSIDPMSGAQHSLARLDLSKGVGAPSALAFLGGYLYVLVSSSAELGNGVLYRYRVT